MRVEVFAEGAPEEEETAVDVERAKAGPERWRGEPFDTEVFVQNQMNNQGPISVSPHGGWSIGARCRGPRRQDERRQQHCGHGHHDDAHSVLAQDPQAGGKPHEDDGEADHALRRVKLQVSEQRQQAGHNRHFERPGE